MAFKRSATYANCATEAKYVDEERIVGFVVDQLRGVYTVWPLYAAEIRLYERGRRINTIRCTEQGEALHGSGFTDPVGHLMAMTAGHAIESLLAHDYERKAAAKQANKSKRRSK